MTKEHGFDWSEPDGLLPADQMNRAKHAKYLTTFLVKKGQEANYILNLDATWGTGKTYFLKRWVKEIENEHPAVYIDAWGSDNSDEPLLSVVSEIVRKLKNLQDLTPLEHNLFKDVGRVIKVAAPTVIKSVITTQLKKHGINSEELIENLSNDDVAELGAKLIKKAIEAHEETTEGTKQIKKSIQRWLIEVTDSKNNALRLPLFIFIDELDRCRPTYAIEMLETIKHIFDMENVVFIIATDKEQLQHSIKAIYGNGFDSRLYLDRFFSRSISLNETSRKQFIAQKLNGSQKFCEYINDPTNFAFVASDKGRMEDTLKLLSGIADGFKWPLRTVYLWIDRIEAALIMSEKKLEIAMLSFLMGVETCSPEWLNKLYENKVIFRAANRESGNFLEFKDFNFKIRWKFNLAAKELVVREIPGYDNRINTIFDDSIGFKEFIINRFKSLSSNKIVLINNIQKSYNDYTGGREIKKQNYNGYQFSDSAMDI